MKILLFCLLWPVAIFAMPPELPTDYKPLLQRYYDIVRANVVISAYIEAFLYPKYFGDQRLLANIYVSSSEDESLVPVGSNLASIKWVDNLVNISVVLAWHQKFQYKNSIVTASQYNGNFHTSKDNNIFIFDFIAVSGREFTASHNMNTSETVILNENCNHTGLSHDGHTASCLTGTPAEVQRLTLHKVNGEILASIKTDIDTIRKDDGKTDKLFNGVYRYYPNQHFALAKQENDKECLVVGFDPLSGSNTPTVYYQLEAEGKDHEKHTVILNSDRFHKSLGSNVGAGDNDISVPCTTTDTDPKNYYCLIHEDDVTGEVTVTLTTYNGAPIYPVDFDVSSLTSNGEVAVGTATNDNFNNDVYGIDIKTGVAAKWMISSNPEFTILDDNSNMHKVSCSRVRRFSVDGNDLAFECINPNQDFGTGLMTAKLNKMPADTENDLGAELDINGTDFTGDDILTISVGIKDAGKNIGKIANFHLDAEHNGTVYSYNLKDNNWKQGEEPAHQGSMLNFPLTPIFRTKVKSLATGSYNINFSANSNFGDGLPEDNDETFFRIRKTITIGP